MSFHKYSNGHTHINKWGNELSYSVWQHHGRTYCRQSRHTLYWHLMPLKNVLRYSDILMELGSALYIIKFQACYGIHVLTVSSSIVVSHFSKLILLMAHCSLRGTQRAFCTKAVAPCPIKQIHVYDVPSHMVYSICTLYPHIVTW